MKSKKCMTGNCPLSEELILLQILPKLPTKSVIRFKSVSKTWSSLISQHSSLIAPRHFGEKPGTIISGRYETDGYDFVRALYWGHNESKLVEIDHSYIYKKKPDRVFLVGSCNGLVYLKLVVYSDKTNDLLRWNPATREVNYLLTGEPYNDVFNRYAVGYDAYSGVAKVVHLIFRREDNQLIKAQILSGGRWRELRASIGNCGLRVPHESFVIDGAIYWQCHALDVLSFDLSKEEFREFDGPIFLGDITLARLALIGWKGFLGAIYAKWCEIHVFLKNKDSNNRDSGWTKVSTIQPSLGRIVSLRRVFGGQIILISKSHGVEKKTLYNLVTNEYRELEGSLQKVHWRSTNFCEHFHTLISPN